MTTKTEAKKAVARLRKGVGPQLQEDISLIADSLDALIEHAAAEMGRMGGAMRAKKLSKERRSEIARMAVKAREDKRKLNGNTKRAYPATPSPAEAEKQARRILDDWHNVEKWHDPSMEPIPPFSGAQEEELKRLIIAALRSRPVGKPRTDPGE